MAERYTRRFRVRHYELDRFGHVNNAVYVKYMQEAAIEASTAAGFTQDWYADQRTSWIIRDLEIRYHWQARYGDKLTVETWVSDIRRSSSNREYKIVRISDGLLVARARVNWIYVNLDSKRPLKIPAVFHDAFQPDGNDESLDVRVPRATRYDTSHRYESRRRVEFGEVDQVQHVHHAVYLEWIQQAYFDAIRKAGWPVEKAITTGFYVLQGGHRIEYFEPAYDHDDILITSWICEIGKVRGAWTHEIRNANSGRLLARDYSLGIFVDSTGKLTAGPSWIIDEVIKGPSTQSSK